MEVFSARLKWLREKSGMSQKEVSEKIDMSQPGYGKIENGQREPNLETLLKIRRLFGESPDFLLNFDVVDIEGENLFELYFECREVREECEADLKYANETLHEDEKKYELRLKLLKQDRERLVKLKERENKALNMFMDYLLTVPGVDEDAKLKEYWLDYYVKEKEARERTGALFYYDLDKLNK